MGSRLRRLGVRNGGGGTFRKRGVTLLVTVLLASCDSGPTPLGSEPEQVATTEPTPSASPDQRRPSGRVGCLDLPDTPPAGKTRVELWFHDRKDPHGVGLTLLVRRDIPTTEAIARATLEAWIAGPTREEKRAGAIPTAPEKTALLGVDIDGDTATIDLSEDFELTGLGTTYEGALVEALAGTLTQFDGVDRGLLKIEGEFKDYYLGHGYIIDEEHPLVRPNRDRYRVAPVC